MPNTAFFRPGVTKCFFVPTIAASTLIPTAAEVNAGSNLGGTAAVPLLADVSGFSFKNAPIEVSTWVDNFKGKVPGWDVLDDSELIFNDYTTTNTLRTTLAKNVSGNIVWFPAGTAGATPAAADKCDVFPGISTGPAKLYSSSENARWRTTWAGTARPVQDVALT